jgi:hypothetical protein
MDFELGDARLHLVNPGRQRRRDCPQGVESGKECGDIHAVCCAVLLGMKMQLEKNVGRFSPFSNFLQSMMQKRGLK